MSPLKPVEALRFGALGPHGLRQPDVKTNQERDDADS